MASTSGTFSRSGARFVVLRSVLKSCLALTVTAAFTLFGLLLATFVIARAVPIDPVIALIGDRTTPEVYERTRLEMGLDKPVRIQFKDYIVRLAHGDLGTSKTTKVPVATELRERFPATFELATLGIIFGVSFGIPLGVLAAVRRGTWIDQIARVVGLLGYSVPVFWLGLMAILLFYHKLELVPSPFGRLSLESLYTFTPVTGLFLLDSALQGQWDTFCDAFMHLILPASLLGCFSMAYISRMTRSFMLNELSQEYVITARVKGLSESRIIWRHALRNAAVPLITVVALAYGGMLEGSVLTENVFDWPGVGKYLAEALMRTDLDAAMGGTLLVGVIFLFVNLMADFLYRVYDPRTRR